MKLLLTVLMFLTFTTLGCMENTIASKDSETIESNQGQSTQDSLQLQQELDSIYQAELFTQDSLIIEKYADYYQALDTLSIHEDSIRVSYVLSKPLTHQYKPGELYVERGSKYCSEGDFSYDDYTDSLKIVIETDFLILKDDFICEYYYSQGADTIFGPEWIDIGYSFTDFDGQCDQSPQEILAEFLESSSIDSAEYKTIFTSTHSFMVSEIDYCWSSSVLSYLSFLSIPDISEIKKVACNEVELVTNGQRVSLKMGALIIGSGTAEFTASFENGEECLYTGEITEPMTGQSCRDAYGYYQEDSYRDDTFFYNIYASLGRYQKKQAMDTCLDDAGLQSAAWIWNVI